MLIRKIVWALNQLPGFGVQKFRHLCEELGDLKLLLDPDVLHRLLPKWGADFVDGFRNLFASGGFEQDEEQCRKAGVQIRTLLDPDYPKNLAQVYDPPLILYVKGTLIPEDQVAVAIVGSRHATTYGICSSSRFASELAERGVTIVSGFARGIDGEAHRGALKAKGRTIAVLGSGLDVVYPKEHGSLYEEIVANGAVISEFPLGTPPQAFHFPKRNRIISGLSLGVLVVEASQRSGSLITARLAAEEGREVYAIPGPIDSLASGGTNQLIRDGAKLVVCTEDILEDIAPQLRALLTTSINCHPEAKPKDPEILRGAHPEHYSAQNDIKIDSLISFVRNEEDPILKLLANQPLSFDEIAAGLGENPARIRSHMTELELKGTVKRFFGGRYVRVSN